ncbi:MAG TPA: PilZ domain-containing protein [Bryobacteraceae bacterium]|nr:PilZ domain-containing protein [Bryobacteraceae bacterium]
MRIPKDRLPPSAVSNPSDPRRARRLVEGEMVVEYWDGVAPAGRGIHDISESGAYICTTEKWYSGAIIRLVFRGRDPKTSVPVLAQVVRQGKDGFAMEFMFNTFRQREEFRKFLAAIPPAAKSAPQPAPAPAVSPVPAIK